MNNKNGLLVIQQPKLQQLPQLLSHLSFEESLYYYATLFIYDI